MKLIEETYTEPLPLPKVAGQRESWHVFEENDPSIDAINTALAAERPLLVRGESGTGKSQLARAAAVALNRAYVSKVVDIRTEAQELFWELDAVERLAEAQVQGSLFGTGSQDVEAQDIEKAVRKALAVEKFVRPGPLWWAFDWSGAEGQANLSNTEPLKPPEKWTLEAGVVMLIDEIDKADSAVPNGLLEALGNGSFPGPGRQEPVVQKDGYAPPLVVITTNEERVLPDAFLRRCVVIELELPKGDALIEFLVKRGRAHFPRLDDKKILPDAARTLLHDRTEVQKRKLSAPGLAEYLDLLRALHRMTDKAEWDQAERTERQGKLLHRIKQYTLQKHPKAQGEGRSLRRGQGLL